MKKKAKKKEKEYGPMCLWRFLFSIRRCINWSTVFFFFFFFFEIEDERLCFFLVCFWFSMKGKGKERMKNHWTR